MTKTSAIIIIFYIYSIIKLTRVLPIIPKELTKKLKLAFVASFIYYILKKQ